MTSAKTINTILNVAMILMLLGWLALISLIAITLEGGNLPSVIKISDDFPHDTKTALITAASYKLVVFALIIYLIWLLKKLVTSLTSGNLFTQYQVAGFKLIGQLIIWVTVINAIIKVILEMIFQSSADISFGFSGFWLFVALGAFFNLLSQVFQNAKKLKEENELTV